MLSISDSMEVCIESCVYPLEIHACAIKKSKENSLKNVTSEKNKNYYSKWNDDNEDETKF